MAVLPLLLISLVFPPSAAPEPREGRVAGRIKCVVGPCLLRRSGAPRLWKLASGAEATLGMQDDVVLWQPKTSAHLSLSQGAELEIKTVASVPALSGEKNLSADGNIADASGKLPAEPEANKVKSDRPDAAVFFLGDLEVELMSPLPHSKLLATKFPQRFPFSFRAVLPRDSRAADVARLKKWTLVDIRKPELPRPLAELQLERVSAGPRQEGEAFDYFAEISVMGPGTYGLVPHGRALLFSEVRAVFEVRPLQGSLRKDIRKNLDALGKGSTEKVFIE
jgi:hypothetical protein